LRRRPLSSTRVDRGRLPSYFVDGPTPLKDYNFLSLGEVRCPCGPPCCLSMDGRQPGGVLSFVKGFYYFESPPVSFSAETLLLFDYVPSGAFAGLKRRWPHHDERMGGPSPLSRQFFGVSLGCFRKAHSGEGLETPRQAALT